MRTVCARAAAASDGFCPRASLRSRSNAACSAGGTWPFTPRFYFGVRAMTAFRGQSNDQALCSDPEVLEVARGRDDVLLVDQGRRELEAVEPRDRLLVVRVGPQRVEHVVRPDGKRRVV